MKAERFAGALALLLFVAGPVAAADIFVGQQVYETHCANCHGVDGGPLVPGTPNFAFGEGLEKPDRPLYDVIKTGSALMPGYNGIINDQEILDVIAYIRTLRR